MKVATSVKPLKADHLRGELLDDSLVLYDEAGETVHILNRTATAIWSLCDGTRDVRQVTKDTARLFGERSGLIRGDVLQMIEELSQVGLVTFDTGTTRDAHWEKA